MNVLSYLTGLFRGHQMNDELQEVRHAARQDAQLVAGAYVQEFEAETARILMGSQHRIASGQEREEAEDAEYEVVLQDYEGWSRPDLMAAARDRGITTERTDTKESLIAKLS